MKHIIFDCDSTVGLPGKPMDDALALLYLLGRPEEAEILGITCTFGNGTVPEVYGSTTRLLQEIGRTDIPLLEGADRGEDPCSAAARFLVDTVNACPGEISLVGLGSLTNFYGAYLLDDAFFDKVKEIVLMGGYTGPVIYHGISLDELNFSQNPAAAACVLSRGRNISILTGNNTLEPSYLPREEFIEKLCKYSDSRLPHQSADWFAMTGRQYIAQKCGYRFDDQGNRYGSPISYCWDVVATVYLLHPELFIDVPTLCAIKEHALTAGWLAPNQEDCRDNRLLNLPQVADAAAYRREMFSGWQNFQIREDIQ